jgi:prepilin-type N-terminal cleavage/methylation domain-containing protein
MYRHPYVSLACKSWDRMPARPAMGFTLIEFAMVLVVLGVLLAGVLKGHELIANARVRSIIQQHEGVKAAFFGFVDRFRQPPGDYSSASANIANMTSAVCGVATSPGDGDGDARVEDTDGEFILAWEHLSKSGFISGDYRCSGNAVVDSTTVPRNPYGAHVQLIYDGRYAGGFIRDQHNFKSGSSVPSDILAEIDRKIDDGSALHGSFRGSAYTTGGTVDSGCWDASTGVWATQTVLANCGAATLF